MSKVYAALDPSGATELTPIAVQGSQDVPIDLAPVAEFFAPVNTPEGYIAAIDWGDGSVSSFGQVTEILVPAIATNPPSPPSPNLGIAGSHTYLEPGTYSVKVNLIRSDGESDWIGTTATIAPAADPVSDLSAVATTGTAGMPLPDALLAQFNVPDASGYRVAIDWGDGSAPTFGSVAIIQRVELVIYAGQPEVGASGTHTYAVSGTYTIKLNLLGPDGESLWVGTTATIAPTPILPPPPVPIVGSSPVATFGTPAWSAALAWARQVADRARAS